ncbi:MAG TPA: glycine cleavage system protein H, partial [Lachnoclostridium phytofermentans]|nr:glycine cleavage system protein H [Lachnoclostridium phytofermentans]
KITGITEKEEFLSPEEYEEFVKKEME